MQTKVINTRSFFDRKDIAAAQCIYPSIWKNITTEWRNAQKGNFAWLSYSANYLFFTAGVRWALDPFSMSDRVPGIPEPEFADDLASLELVVLSHQHNDHLDLNLITKLAHLPITWVIPAFLIDWVLTRTSLDKDKVIVPTNGNMIRFRNLSLLPFDSLHYHGRSGVPETGYLAEFDNRRWLFPGDVRNYSPKSLPSFGPLDGCFAHLWLGKAKAKLENPPLLNDYCLFHSSFQARQIITTHLYEYGRDELDLWDQSHYEMTRNMFKKLSPDLGVSVAMMGDRVTL